MIVVFCVHVDVYSLRSIAKLEGSSNFTFDTHNHALYIKTY